jgi:hypothetical protein
MTEKKYSRKHIGEVWKDSSGGSIEIIDGGSKNDYNTIRFECGFEKEVRYDNVKAGTIKNPFKPIVRGVGFIGTVTEVDRKSYSIWAQMLNRCYSKDWQELNHTYKDVAVCPEWHNYSNFKEWFDKNYIETFQLDKDLLGTSKLYSQETCCFIPRDLNKFIGGNIASTKGYRKTGNKYQAQICYNSKQIYLGMFDTPEEAHQAYLEARKEAAQFYKEKYKDILPQKILERIK